MVNEPSREIIGVVGDIRHNRYDREAQPQMYVPYVQHPLVSQGGWVDFRLTMTFLVRSAGDPVHIVPALRGAVAEVDHNLPIFNVKTLDEYVEEQIWQPQQTMTLPFTPRETSSSARLRPAFSIRTRLGNPSSAMARCSSARTSAQLSTGEVIGGLSG